MNHHEKVIIECDSGFIESQVWHAGKQLALDPNGHFNLRIHGKNQLEDFLGVLHNGGKWEYSRALVEITLGNNRVYFYYSDLNFPPGQTIAMTKDSRNELAAQALIALNQKD